MEDLAQRNRANLERWFREVWDERRIETIYEMMSPEVRAYGMGDGPLDREGFIRAWRGMLEAFPDFEFRIEHMVCDGAVTSARHRCSGTHLGEGLGVPPSGKKISFLGQTFTTWKDDKVVDSRNTLDMASVYRQIEKA